MKEAFFEISQKDLEASKLLFKNKLYPQAVFYLQQSVEKLTKSFAIDKIITLEEAKCNIRHHSFKIYKKMAKSLQKEIEDFEEIISKNPRLGKNKIVKSITSKVNSKKVREYLNLLTLMEKKRAYNLPSKKDIKASIELLNVIESIFDKSSLPSILTKQKLEEYEKYAGELLDAFFEQDPEIAKKVKNGVHKFLSQEPDEILKIGERWMDLLYVIFSSLLLSYLLPWFHAIYTRYPDKKGQNPREIYNEEHPLIQFYDDLVKIIEKTFSKTVNLFIKETNRERVK